MRVFYVRHQKLGVLHDHPYETTEEAEKAAELMRAAEKERPAWLKAGAEWWCARAVEPGAAPAPSAPGTKANVAGMGRIAIKAVGTVKNPKEE